MVFRLIPAFISNESKRILALAPLILFQWQALVMLPFFFSVCYIIQKKNE